MPRLSVAWVMLQRVPPDMRILTPGFLFFSRRSTCLPRSAARRAAIKPAAPAPTTTTSHGAWAIAIFPTAHVWTLAARQEIFIYFLSQVAWRKYPSRNVELPGDFSSIAEVCHGPCLDRHFGGFGGYRASRRGGDRHVQRPGQSPG